MRAVLLLIVLATLASAGTASSSTAAPLSGEWHRLSVDRSHPAPEHELLRCVETSAPGSPWLCRYRKAPEPTLNLTWNNNFGAFTGSDVTSTWTCPVWFCGRCLCKHCRGDRRDHDLHRPGHPRAAALRTRRPHRRSDAQWGAALRLLGRSLRLPLVQVVRRRRRGKSDRASVRRQFPASGLHRGTVS